MLNRSRWTFLVVAAALLCLAGSIQSRDVDPAGDSPLYGHIAELSAGGMADRVWNTSDVTDVADADNRQRADDLTVGGAGTLCTDAAHCTSGTCTSGTCTNDFYCTADNCTDDSLLPSSIGGGPAV